MRFVRPDKLFEINYFRKLDEPNAEPLTEDRIMDMKDRLIHESFYGSISTNESVISSVEQVRFVRKYFEIFNLLKKILEIFFKQI